MTRSFEADLQLVPGDDASASELVADLLERGVELPPDIAAKAEALTPAG